MCKCPASCEGGGLLKPCKGSSQRSSWHIVMVNNINSVDDGDGANGDDNDGDGGGDDGVIELEVVVMVFTLLVMMMVVVASTRNISFQIIALGFS